MDKKDLKHIAIIPDGNRRWARAKGQVSVAGHRFAVEHTLPALYDQMLKLQIPYCTFWVLSPENFTKRSTFEINNLFTLMSIFLEKRLVDMHQKNICIKVIGDIDTLPSGAKSQIQQAIEKTKKNTGLVFIFAINYGGRNELQRAIQKLIAEQKEITDESITSALDTHGIPDPDLIIRTGEEVRTSGFLIWQSVYAEYIFRDELFPDFTPEMLRECIEIFYMRKRRFGS
jgi:undecaprenyl diphosphate synthase